MKSAPRPPFMKIPTLPRKIMDFSKTQANLVGGGCGQGVLYFYCVLHQNTSESGRWRVWAGGALFLLRFIIKTQASLVGGGCGLGVFCCSCVLNQNTSESGRWRVWAAGCSVYIAFYSKHKRI